MTVTPQVLGEGKRLPELYSEDIKVKQGGKKTGAGGRGRAVGWAGGPPAAQA